MKHLTHILPVISPRCNEASDTHPAHEAQGCYLDAMKHLTRIQHIWHTASISDPSCTKGMNACTHIEATYIEATYILHILNETCHTHELKHVKHMNWNMSHTWIETCHTHELKHVKHMNWNMSHTWIETCQTHELKHATHMNWSMSHTWNEILHTCKWHAHQLCKWHAYQQGLWARHGAESRGLRDTQRKGAKKICKDTHDRCSW